MFAAERQSRLQALTIGRALHVNERMSNKASSTRRRTNVAKTRVSRSRRDSRYAATLAIFFTGVQRKLEKMFGTREALIVWGSAKFSSCCRGVPAVPTTSTYAAALLVQGWEVVLSSR